MKSRAFIGALMAAHAVAALASGPEQQEPAPPSAEEVARKRAAERARASNDTISRRAAPVPKPRHEPSPLDAERLRLAAAKHNRRAARRAKGFRQ